MTSQFRALIKLTLLITALALCQSSAQGAWLREPPEEEDEASADSDQAPEGNVDNVPSDVEAIFDLLPGQPDTQPIYKQLFYSFDGLKGDVITLRVTSWPRGVVPRVSLTGPGSDKTTVTDHSNGGQVNGQINGYSLKKSGTYTVKITAPGANGGNVTVQLWKPKLR